MPQEVSDIKQFIEICRRKDAKCMVPSLYYYPRASSSIPSSFNSTPISRLTHEKNNNSGTHKAKSQNTANQVQSPMPPLPIHTRAQRLEQSGQAKAELTSKYVIISDFLTRHLPREKDRETFFSSDESIAYLKRKQTNQPINQTPRSHKHNQRRPKEEQEREEGSINRPIASCARIDMRNILSIASSGTICTIGFWHVRADIRVYYVWN